MPDLASDLRVFILTIVYAVLGMVLLFAGYRVFDRMTPTDMQKDIFENRNTAVAIVTGCFILGLAIIIGMAIHG